MIFFTAAFFVGPVSRFSFLTALPVWLAWGRPKFEGRYFFHCCIFGGPVSRFSFLTALLGRWPGGSPSFKVGIFFTAAFLVVQFPGFHF